MMLETLAHAGQLPGIMREKEAATDAVGAEVRRRLRSLQVLRELEAGREVVYTKIADYVPRAEPPDGKAGGQSRRSIG